MANEQERIQLIHLVLKNVPQFNGDPNRLYRFIATCDDLVSTYVVREFPIANATLLNGILNKITGNAEDVLNISGNNTSWADIRRTLIENFADQRDETTLNRDLTLLRQGNETPQDFYVRCQQMLSKIINFVNLNIHDDSIKTVKRTFYTEQALQTFIAGLKDPIGSQIRCMQPTTLPMALKYVQKEQNIRYIQTTFPSSSSSKNVEVRQPTTFNMPIAKLPVAMPQQRGPTGNAMGNPNPFTHTYRVFRGPGPVQNQGFKPHQNNFQNPNKFNNAPRPQFNYGAQARPHVSEQKPMSGVSTIKNTPRFRPGGQDLSNFQNPTNRYFRTREVNFNDSYPYEPEQYYYMQESEDSYPYYPDYYAVEYANNINYDNQEISNTEDCASEPNTSDFQEVVNQDPSS